MEISGNFDFMISFKQLFPKNRKKKQKMQDFSFNFGLFWICFDSTILRKLAFVKPEMIH